jgi:hypothetical protein
MLMVREHPYPRTLVRSRRAVVCFLYSVPYEQRDSGESRRHHDETFACFHNGSGHHLFLLIILRRPFRWPAIGTLISPWCHIYDERFARFAFLSQPF